MSVDRITFIVHVLFHRKRLSEIFFSAVDKTGRPDCSSRCFAQSGSMGAERVLQAASRRLLGDIS